MKTTLVHVLIGQWAQGLLLTPEWHCREQVYKHPFEISLLPCIHSTVDLLIIW